jgi:uncharacterized protein with HEPN domain
MWRDEAYLLDMLIAAKSAKEFLSTIEWEEFEESKLHYHAVVNTIGIIGEGARKISKEFKNAHPEIKWDEIIELRNKLIHEYFRIDPSLVWQFVQNNIPILINQLESIVPSEEK